MLEMYRLKREDVYKRQWYEDAMIIEGAREPEIQ